MSHFVSLLTVLFIAAGCGGEGDVTDSSGVDDQLYPDVVAVQVSKVGGRYRFDVTISSPYESADRYADAWRVVGGDGTVYGVRDLLHDHAGEQPFTRSLDGVEIPAGTTVIVEGRDQVNGWGGSTVEVTTP